MHVYVVLMRPSFPKRVLILCTLHSAQHSEQTSLHFFYKAFHITADLLRYIGNRYSKCVAILLIYT